MNSAHIVRAGFGTRLEEGWRFFPLIISWLEKLEGLEI
jgi:hypothetical protein